MKGTITNCLAELVEERFGKDKWQAIQVDAGVTDGVSLRMPISDVDDGLTVRLLDSTAKVLGISAEAAADAFGEYWCCTYAPRLYGSIVSQFKTAKDMLLGLDSVHVKMTQSMQNARPPRFDYRWLNDKELHVTYKSKRNLLQVYIGLARGVGKFYKTPLTIKATGKDTVSIRWD